MIRSKSQTKSSDELKKIDEGFNSIKKPKLVFCKVTECGAHTDGICAFTELPVNFTSICEIDSEESLGQERK